MFIVVATGLGGVDVLLSQIEVGVLRGWTEGLDQGRRLSAATGYLNRGPVLSSAPVQYSASIPLILFENHFNHANVSPKELRYLSLEYIRRADI